MREDEMELNGVTVVNETAAGFRAHLESAIRNLQAAETAFHAARASKERAIQTASAQHHLNATEAHKSASDGILEAAANVEEILSLYNEASAREYAAAMQAATVESRELYGQRPELVQALADLDKAIAVAEEKEKPAVTRATGMEFRWSSYGQQANEFKTRVVRLVLEDQARTRAAA
jgi:hypothetical protein